MHWLSPLSHSRLLSESAFYAINENENMTCDVLLSFSTYGSDGISSFATTSEWASKLSRQRNSFIFDRNLQFSFWGLTCFRASSGNDKTNFLTRNRLPSLASRGDEGRILLLFIRWENLSLIIRIRTNMKFVFWVFWLISHSTLKRWSKEHARRVLFKWSCSKVHSTVVLLDSDWLRLIGELINVTSKIEKFLHSRLSEFLLRNLSLNLHFKRQRATWTQREIFHASMCRTEAFGKYFDSPVQAHKNHTKIFFYCFRNCTTKRFQDSP